MPSSYPWYYVVLRVSDSRLIYAGDNDDGVAQSLAKCRVACVVGTGRSRDDAFAKAYREAHEARREERLLLYGDKTKPRPSGVIYAKSRHGTGIAKN